MLRVGLVLALGLLLGLAGPAMAAPRQSGAEISGRRVALVVGNGAYRSVDRLANPANDARLMAETLRRLGFTLVGDGPLLDLDRAHLAQAVQDFGHALAGAEVGLFYYSGHGLQVQGVNWLVPIDANPTRPQDLDFQMVDADLVLRQMDGAGTKLNLVLLDACRNNPFAVRGLRAVQSGLAEMRAPEGTLISYATQPGNVAADGVGSNSPYTSALAETMQQPGVDIFRLFNQVGLQVKRGTGGSQQPWVSTSPIDGDFFFAGAARPPADVVALARPAPLPPSVPEAPQVALDPIDRLRELARRLPCAALDIQKTAVGIDIRGVTQSGPAWAGFQREIGGNKGIRLVTPDIEILQSFACEVVTVLAEPLLLARRKTGERLIASPRREFTSGETLSAVLREGAGGVARLDLYAPDGSVQHLKSSPLVAASGEVSAPLAASDAAGPRLLSVVVTPAPLDLGARPATERAGAYLADLSRSLRGREVLADVTMITIRASSAPVMRPVARPVPPSPRCSAIAERAQLGEPPSDADRAFLQAQCR